MIRYSNLMTLRTVALAALIAGPGAAMAQLKPPTPARVCAGSATTCIFGGGASTLTAAFAWDVPTFTPPYTSEMGLQFALTPAVDFTFWNVTAPRSLAAFLTNSSVPLSGVAGTVVDYGVSEGALSATQATTPLPTGGAKILFPVIASATALPIRLPAPTNFTSGTQVAFTDAQLCGIFSGAITTWNDPKLKTAYAASLTPKPTGTITVAYRIDSAATTNVLAQHLSLVCGASSPFAQWSTLFAAGTSGTFVNYFPNKVVPTNFTGFSTLAGMTTGLLGLSSAIGYDSPDRTAVNPQSPLTTSLLTASLKNAFDANAPFQPNYANTSLAINNPGANSINVTPPATLTDAADVTKWTPVVPTPAKGYPLVGYFDWIGATCYANPAVATGIRNFLINHLSAAAFKTDVTRNGFVPVVPTSYAAQVKAVFLTNTSGYNLNIQNATACSGVTGR